MEREDLSGTINVDSFFLNRLERFANIAQSSKEFGVLQQIKLASHATLSAYRDCVALGLEQKARAILTRVDRDYQP